MTKKEKYKPKTRYPAEPLTDEELQALLDACSNRGVCGPRNKAMILFLCKTGVRCAEALALRPCDIDKIKGVASVLHGKGDKARVVGIASRDWVVSVIERWEAIRATLPITPASTIFCSSNGKLLSTSYVRRALKGLAARAGIQKRVHAHGLRHTFAVAMRKANVDVAHIQAQLGHGDLATTIRYMRHLNPEDALQAIQLMAWFEPKKK